MRSLSTNQRGIVLMLVAIGLFSINDAFVKLASQSLPPLEVLFLRACFFLIWSGGFLAVTGGFGQFARLKEPTILARSLADLLAMFGFVLGIANLPIAEFTALNMVSPILMMLVAGIFLKGRITRTQYGLAGLAFIGTLLVAQPGGSSFSWYSLFGLWSAAFVVARDLFGRAVPAGVTGMAVAFVTGLVSVVGTFFPMMMFETFKVPELMDFTIVGIGALFLLGGQAIIFLAYREADTGVVAPFVYSGVFYSMVIGVLVFGTVPNMLAFVGMVLIVLSGVAVLLVKERQPEPVPAEV